jgi:hypothetical protein
MSINHVFRRRKNSHEFFFGNMYEADSGATVLELRLMESDGKGGSKDSRKIRFRTNIESLPIIIELLREAAASTGGAR